MSTRLFSGSTEECLAEYFREHKWEPAQSAMAEFSKVGKPTVRRWHTGEITLRGESLISVRVFLDACGYDVTEFSELPQVTRQFARLIAFELLSIEEARQLLAYGGNKDVYRIVLRSSGLSGRRVQKLEEFVRRHEDRIHRVLSKTRAQLSKLPPSEKDESRNGNPRSATHIEKSAVAQPSRANQVDGQPGVTSDEVAIQIMVSLLSAACTLASVFDSAKASESWRAVQHMIGRERLQQFVHAIEDVLE